MAIPLAECLLTKASDIGAGQPVDWTRTARAWTSWAREAKDVGSQTHAVISAARGLARGNGR